MSWREVPCEQRLYFHCVSHCAKSSLCQQPFHFLSITVQFSLVHARNSSCKSWATLIVRSVVKIGMSFTAKKNWDNSVLLRKTHAIITQCSKKEKTLFLKFICSDFWTDLHGSQQRLLYAHQLTKRKCSLCWQPFNSDLLCYPCYPLLPMLSLLPLLPLVTPCYPC